MSKIAFLLTLLVTALVCLLPAAPAQAQVARTFVSAAGSDSNNCASVSTPCQHFQAAVNATALGGEVVALDPAKYGSFTINQAITIEGQGWSYVSPPGSGAAITINANSGDNVVIRGVLLNGDGTTGTNGIVFNSGGNLTVTDCVAQNFSFSSSGGNGILMQPTSGAMTFVITNTIVTNNNSGGIVYAPPRFSTATANGVIDRVVATNNFIGIAFQTTNGGGATTGAISNSVVGNSSADGISAQNAYPSGAALVVSIDNTSSTSNSGSGVVAAVTATVILGRSVLTANSTYGLRNLTSPNTVYSYQDNRINGNGTSSADDVNGSSPNPYTFK
jgi:hypothetical protein